MRSLRNSIFWQSCPFRWRATWSRHSNFFHHQNRASGRIRIHRNRGGTNRMREVNLLDEMPQPESRVVGSRTIEHRIIASYRGREFFDGDRNCGYGGYVDDGRWGPVAERMIEYYKLKEGDRVVQINCEKGFLLAEFQARRITAT